MQPKRVFDFFQLEDRILLSGESPEGEVAENPDTVLFDALLEEIEADGQAASANLFVAAGEIEEQSSSGENVTSGEAFAIDEIDPELPLEVVFIDSGVEDADVLVDGIRDGADDGVQWLVIQLAADSDGVDQISEALARVSGIDAVHLVSHGDGNGIQLGNTTLSSGSAAGYASDLAGWAGSLDEGADLLIYGCNLASTSEGQDLIAMLAAVCDCDVAASDDATGHESLAGDWLLEYSVGDVSTEIAFGFATQATWGGTLDMTTGLEAHLELDDGSGTTAADATANNNDGTVNGSALWTSGEIGGAFDFNYTDGADFIEIANSPSLENVQEGDFSLAAWFRPDSTPPGSGSDPDAHYGIMIKTGWHTGLSFGNDNRFYFDHVLTGDNAVGVVSTHTFTPGQFYHVAGVLDRAAGTISLYIDGQHEGTSSFTPGTAAREYGTETWKLGAANPAGGAYSWAAEGAIDDARIYSRTLTSGDVGELAGINGDAPQTVTFLQGLDGYSGTHDTYLDAGTSSTNYGNNSTLEADLDSNGFETQSVIQFDSLFGEGAGQISTEAYVQSASLEVYVTNASIGTISLHQMLNSWDESTATWGSFSGGLTADGVQMEIAPDGQVTNPSTGTTNFTGLETTVQSWASGAASNYGWGILNDSTDGWDFDSSEGTIVPSLSVTYVNAGSQTSVANTLTVDTTSDVLDGDATSIDTLLANRGADGLISLREAIWAANNTKNVDGSTPDVINFASGTGAQTILVGAGGLPNITDAVVIDASTQPGYSGTPLITLDGSNATGATAGLNLRTNNSTIRGFIVHSFPDEGIEIDGSTGFGDNNLIEDNWVGITAGSGSAGNAEDGILVSETADNNEIRNNVVGNSGGDGIHVRNDSDGNWLWGNTVGLANDGSTPHGNTGYGIHLSGTVSNTKIGGDGAAGEGNVISGNAQDGLFLNADGTTVVGNLIGVDATGTLNLGNGGDGIQISGDNNIIGGSASGDRNVISGNNDEGIDINAGATGTVIQGNYVGTNADGDAAVPNGAGGVGNWGGILVGGHNTTVGGVNPGEGNLISGNHSWGVILEGNNNVVLGNLIGTAVDGITALGNSGHGILVTDFAGGLNNLAGGTTAGAGNVIANNGLDGITVTGIADVTIVGNSIADNAGLAIDLGDNGVSANDTDDADSGANDGQNFPVIAQADLSGTDLTLSGTLDTDGVSSEYRIEFFGNAGGSEDGSGHGEGSVYLGFTTVTTDGSGDATFAGVILSGVTFSDGDVVTATATRIDDPGQVGLDDAAAYGTTSEFAANTIIANANYAPLFIGGGVGYWQFDEGVGETTSDSVYGTSIGTLGSTAAADGNDPTWTTGQFGQALQFDGVDDYVEIADAAELDISGSEFSASLWVKPDSGPNTEDMFFMKGDRTGNVNYYLAWKDTGDMTWAFKDGAGWHYLDMNVPLPTVGQWNHVAIVFNRPDVSLYINGTEYTFSNTATGGSMDRDLTGNGEPLWVGAGRSGGSLVGVNQNSGPFDGAIDELAIYDRALTAAEIEAIRTSQPAAATATAFAIDENSTNGTAVGTVAVSDQDVGDTHTYAITAGNIGGTFAIDANGNITVADTSQLDFQTNASFTLTVEATDDGADPLSDSTNVLIDLNDIDESPLAIDDPTTSEGAILSNAPVGYWRLGESSGPTAVNLGSNGVDGTFNGPTLGVAGAPNAGGDTAADFDGSNDYIDLGTMDVNGTGITLSAWVNIDSFVPDADHRIISKADSTTQGVDDHWWMLSTEDVAGENYLRFRVKAGGDTSTLLASGVNLNTNEWLFATATYDAGSGEMKIFLNGSEIASRTHAVGGAVDTDATKSAWIGANPNGGTTYFDGQIDEVAIYDQALTASQIQQMYNADGGTYSASEEATLVVSAANGVLANDRDPEGNPLTAVLVTGPSNASSFTLNADGSFSYTGTANFSGTDTFTYRANDGTLDSEITTATVTVTNVNDAPVLTPYTPTYSATEDGAPFTTSVSAFIGSSVTDADAGEVKGVAITGLSGGGATLTYSLDGGTTWFSFDSLSESNALLLRSTDLVSFEPATDNGGSMTVQYRAWDQTTGTAGNSTDTTSNGGTTAFSTASDQVTVNTASVNDAPIAVNDHHGLRFDGVDDYVNLGSDSSLEFTNLMTMELWARPTAYPAASNVILNKEGEYEIGISSTGSLMWAFDNTDPDWNWYDTGHVLQLDEWSHIAVTYDNGTVHTYVNGHHVDTYLGSGSIGDAHADKDDLRVGGRENNPAGQYFAGEIDEVRLWSTARTQTEIQNNLDQSPTGSETGLAGYWNLNEGSGSVANDLTGNANHGTLTDEAMTGAPSWTGYSTDQNTAINVATSEGVLTNDVDVDGDLLSVSAVEGSGSNVGGAVVIASGATVTLNPDGSFSYDPNGAFNFLAASETTIDSFTYTASDGNGGSDSATVSITINGINDAPVAAGVEGSFLAYTENDGEVVVTSTIQFTDLDDTHIESAVVRITGGYDLSEDVIRFSDQSGITGDWDQSSGTMTLSGSATLADYEAAIRSIAYTNKSESPSATTRTVSISVNDGETDSNVLTRDVTVTAANDAPVIADWYNNGWQYRKEIIVDAGQVSGDLVGFPILVDLNADVGLANFAQLDGDDILFTSADGTTKLAHEFELYQSGTGELVTWVNTDLSGYDDTRLYMYYGNSSVASQQDAVNVWDSGYQGIWHLSQSPDGSPDEIIDSTSNNNDGTTEGSMDASDLVNTQIGTGLDFDEVDDLIRVGDSASLDSTAAAGTFEVWINFDNAADGDHQIVMTSSNRFTTGARDGYEWASQGTGNHFYYPYGGTDPNYVLGPNPFTNGQWHHLAVTQDFVTREVVIYVDGVEMGVSSDFVLGNWNTLADPADWLWGGNPDRPTRYFDGMMDEIRVSNVVRSEDWIATSASNQSDPSIFVTTGTAESRDLTLTDISEDATNPAGNSVASMLASAGGDRITDRDSGAVEGIAVVGVDDTNGAWQYDSGGGWTDFGPVSDAGAVLLDPTAAVRFVPNADYNGSAGQTVFRAWDQTDGNSSGATGIDVTSYGGTTAYGSIIDSATLQVTSVNDAPVADNIEVTDLAYTENDGITPVTDAITFSDVDDTNIESAVVQITANYNSSEDLLSFTNQSGITGVYDSGMGRWTLTGSATLAQYETAIRSITYINTDTNENPDTNTRTVSFTVNDGETNSNTLTRDITVGSVNDDPTNTGTLPTDVAVTEDVLSNVDLSAVDFSDVDAGGSNLTVTLSTSTGGSLSATSGGGVTVGGTASASTFTGSIADLNTYFNTASNIQYLHGTSGTTGNDADTMTVIINDNGNSGTGGGTDQNLGTVNVDIGGVNDAPVNTVPGTQTVAEETTTAISGLSISDVDAGANNLTTRLQVSSGALNLTLVGSASIAAGSDGSSDLTLQGTVADINATLASLTYTGNTDVVGTGADTLTVTTNDLENTGSGGAQSDVDTVQIDITAVNDEEVLATNTGITVAEGSTGNTLTTAMLQTTDVDNTDGQLVYTVDAVTATGTLRLSGTALGLNDTFTQAEIDAGNVTYDHNGSEPPGDSFKFIVDDGQGTTTSGTFSLAVTAVNDNTPTITSGGGGATASVNLFENAIFVTTITATDADLPAQTLTFSIIGGSDSASFAIDSSTGELSLVSAPNHESPTDSGGDNVYDVTVQVSDGIDTDSQAIAVTVTDADEFDVGAVSDNNATTNAVDENVANGTLVGITASASDADSTNNTITYSLDDNAGARFMIDSATGVVTVANGTLFDHEIATSHNITVRATSADTSFGMSVMTVGVNNVNESPSIATNTGATVAEGSTGNVVSTAMLNEGDVDDSGVGLTYTVTDVTDNGTLFLAGFGALRLNDTFTQADIDAGDVTYDHDGSETASDAFGFTLADGGEDGVTPATGTFNFTVTNSNDAPVNMVPGARTVNEDTATAITGISVADDDNNLSTVRLTVVNGSLNVTLNGSASISAGSNGSGDLTLSGSLADINITLGSLTYHSNLNDSGSDTLTVLSTDSDAATDSDTVNITVGAVNDTPDVSAPGSAYSATEQTNLRIEGTGFSVTDVDAASGVVTATFTVGEGAVSLAAGDSGVSISSNNAAVVTFTGTLAQINSLLTGSSTGTIIYNNGSDTPSASTTLTLTVNDGGNLGADPGLTADGTSEADSASQTINLTATNDDPTNTGSLPSDVSVTEDVLSNVVLSAVDFSDLDAAGSSLAVTLSTSSGGGLTLATDGSLTFGGTATARTITGTLPDLNAYFDNVSSIQYQHGSPHIFGDNADTITVVINDNGHTGSGGGTDQTLGSINIDIVAVNDSPTVAVNTGMTVDEGSAGNVISNVMLNEGDVDDSGAELTYTVSSLPARGTLRNNGAALGLGGTFTQADLDAGRVTYDHDDSETTSDSFSFTLTDDGEDGATSASGTFNISVNPINDNTISAIIDSDVSAEFVLENSTSGTFVGVTAFAEELDAGDTITYSLADDDSGRFAIDSISGEVAVAGPIDRESDGASRQITVRATSTDSSFQDRVFFIGIGDTNEFGVGSISDSDATANQVAENAAMNSPVGLTALAIDGDATNNTITYTLDDDDGGRFAIDGNSGEITISGTFDAAIANSHNLTVRATSSDGSSTIQVFTVAIVDVNDPPTASGESYTINAGSPLNVSAPGVLQNDSDVNGDPMTVVVITPPTGAALFSLSPDGSLLYQPGGGFLGVDTIQYRVSDGFETSQTVTIEIEVVAFVATGGVDQSDPVEPDEASDAADETTPSPQSESESETKTEGSAATKIATATATTAVVNDGSAVATVSPVGLDGSRSSFFGTSSLADAATTEFESEVFVFVSRDLSTGREDSSQVLELQRLLELDIEQAIIWTQWEETQFEEATLASYFVGSASVGVGLFSIGYATWALRGGTLFALVSSTIPAWRLVDPATMLTAYRDASRLAEDDQVESIIAVRD